MIFLLLPHDTNKYHTLIIMCLFNYTSSTLDSFVLWMTHFFPSSFFLLSFNPVDEEEALMKHFNIFLFSMSRERESIFVYISSLRLSKWLLESYVKYVPEDRTSRTNMNEVKREREKVLFNLILRSILLSLPLHTSCDDEHETQSLSSREEQLPLSSVM